MNSSIYECRVMHQRLSPQQHRFSYRVYMFCLDLDELDELVRQVGPFSRNRFNVFSFHDADHIPGPGSTTRERLAAWLRSKGVVQELGQVKLLTNLRVLGHVFNPVSFYFCSDKAGVPLCAVAEVGNTFGEQKPFLVPVEGEASFRQRTVKHFYVSPFVDHDLDFEFRLEMPGGHLRIDVDDFRGEERLLVTTLRGEAKPFTTGQAIWSFVRFPLVTLHVVAAIHWQALRLWLKGVPFKPKSADPELQRDFHRLRSPAVGESETARHPQEVQ